MNKSCQSRSLLRCVFLFTALIALASSGVAIQSAAAQPHLSDGSGAYSTGKYRNVFVEQGHSSSETATKIEAAYQQLFHGDHLTQAIFFSVGSNANGPLAYITDWATLRK